MNIAIVFSPDWMQHVAVEVFAIFKNNPPPVKVFLISDQVEHIGNLSHICEFFGSGYSYEPLGLEGLYNRRMPSGINVDSRFTKYTLYRLLLPDLLDIDRLLYIDADAICNGDLTKLYHMDMGHNLIAGVIDSGAGADQYNLKAPLGLAEDDIYINAGVALWNVDEISRLGLGQRWVKECNEKHYPAHDQDIINMTCRGRIKDVDQKYNVSLSTGLDVGDIRIMHYAGKKPWDTPDVPHYHIWQYYASEYRRLSERLPQPAQQRIPKKIHYCWFGGRPKPAIVEKCLASWQKHLPGYEIIEWNESNFDINSCPYVRAAYDSGKYAFVTDYVRMWALYQYGGIYMDSDVEILKPLDRFLSHQAFTGHETDELMVTAVMGAEPRHELIGILLDYYRNAVFKVIPNTQTITRLLQPYVERAASGYRYLRSDMVIYPIETFCPYDHHSLKPTPTDNSYAIHHFAGTWLGRTRV